MAKKKICLDAGHFGKYNRSPVNNAYYESDMVWKLHLMLKEQLEKYGFDVILTRENQKNDKALYDRGAMSVGCDLFLSLHSNAVANGKNENVDYPVMYVPLSGKGDKLGQELADCIAKTMGTKQAGRISKRKSSSGGEYYGVIRGAVAVGTVGMIVEHSFHTNTRSTNWLLKDNNLEKLAKAEAAVIAEHFGVSASSAPKPEQDQTPSKEQDVDLLTGKVKVIYDGKDGLNVRKSPCMSDNVDHVVYAGTFTVVGISEDKKWYKLASGLYITTDTDYVKFTATSFAPYAVRVSADDLNIRKGAGIEFDSVGHTGKGVFTIIAEKSGKVDGKGNIAKWGLLKAYENGKNGWICLDYAKKV